MCIVTETDIHFNNSRCLFQYNSCCMDHYFCAKLAVMYLTKKICLIHCSYIVVVIRGPRSLINVISIIIVSHVVFGVIFTSMKNSKQTWTFYLRYDLHSQCV